MNNKQLSEMIKALRKKKLAEVIGKSAPFNPKHKATHKEDPTSPNQPFNEENINELGGTYHLRKRSKFKETLGDGKERSKFQLNGQQSMKGGRRYTYEEDKKEVELGPTDTGQSGETVTQNPTDNTASAKISMNKNTNTKSN